MTLQLIVEHFAPKAPPSTRLALIPLLILVTLALFALSCVSKNLLLRAGVTFQLVAALGAGGETWLTLFVDQVVEGIGGALDALAFVVWEERWLTLTTGRPTSTLLAIKRTRPALIFLKVEAWLAPLLTFNCA